MAIPFLLDEIREWSCNSNDFKSQISVPNLEDRFAATYLNGIKDSLSDEAKEVLNKGRELFKFFYENINKTNWKLYKCDCWDVGLYQVRMTLKDAAIPSPLDALLDAHRRLRASLLPRVYEAGFLVRDCEWFGEGEVNI